MRFFTSYFLIAVLACCAALALFGAQSSHAHASASLRNQEEAAVWERYRAKGEEFSVMLPELPGVVSRTRCLEIDCKSKRQEFVYAAYADGGVYLITSYQNSNRRLSLEEIIAESLTPLQENDVLVSRSDVKLEAFSGKKFVIGSKNSDYSRVVIYYQAREHVYELKAVNENLSDPAIQKFFDSFRLGEKTGKEIGDGARIGPATMPAAPAASKTAESAKDSSAPAIFRPVEVTRKARIVYKAVPEYTEEARQNELTGTVVLQMVLASSGKVVNIRTVSGLPFGLTEKAIAAARKIYFIPANKDGKRVSQYIRVEYNFNLY